MTTTVLALAAAWPDRADDGVRPVVVEADVSGGDLAVRFGCPHTPGLLDVATAARKDHPGSLLGATAELQLGVRVVVSPAGGRACAEAVRLVAEFGQQVLLGEVGDQGTVVLDVGRLGAGAEGLLDAAETVVLVSRGGADALAHVYAYLTEVGPLAQRYVLVVIGPCPYGPGEISATLGVTRVVFLPWDPKAAAVLAGDSHAALRISRWKGLRLMTAAREVAWQLNGSGEAALSGLSADLAGLGAMPAQGGPAQHGLAGLAAKEADS
ncbi:hypothetical protein V2J94_03565 [Streptomyces sp. DSM 41524]|uniref:Uncharacterized protein n=1 Tax=Streptomyces asiaticus subsp. ignotus TaxID=3098222 RepID=A0ABU7PPI1_9ACTN|nr:hypothetical protein [Streptomyces sp. DSM 41524]